MMGRMVSDHQKKWDVLLPHVMAAYRASEHQSTGYSPNYLMFGREVKAPADLTFETPGEDRQLPMIVIQLTWNTE